MGLIGNYTVLNKSYARFINGTSTTGAYAANTKSNWTDSNTSFAKNINTFPKKSSIPYGYNVGEALIISRSSGGIASVNQMHGYGALTATAIQARMSQADLTGTGNISSAQISSLIKLIASLSGTGDLTASLGILTGMISTATGVGDISGNLSAIVKMSALLSGSGSVTADLKGTGSLSASIIIGASGYLSQDDINRLTEGVWNALAASFNTSGTMGEKLNGAGSAGNPWTELIETGFTAKDILRVLSSIAVGKTSITDLGGGNATVVFRDINDTKDRVTANMTGSERTSVTTDPV